MSHPLLEKLAAILDDAEKRLAAVTQESELEAIRVEILGRKGTFPALSREMGTVPNELKPQVGQAFNQVKNGLQIALDTAKERIENAQSASPADGIDVTLPGRRPATGREHPISQVMDECISIFRRMGFVVAEGPEIDDVHHNFDALNTPADHPSRDPQDTFYFEDGRLLRTQTSSVQVRVMESVKPPVRIISPGRCFRRDTPDATHSMNFHQIEGLYVDRKVSLADLQSTLLHFAHELLGNNASIRCRPHFFPFTEPSLEVDFTCIMCKGKGCRVCKNSGWLEILGAGMVHPNVFRAVGYDPEEWTGFAFGMGIERIAMLRYRIHDIRMLYENDQRFLEQF